MSDEIFDRPRGTSYEIIDKVNKKSKNNMKRKYKKQNHKKSHKKKRVKHIFGKGNSMPMAKSDNDVDSNADDDNNLYNNNNEFKGRNHNIIRDGHTKQKHGKKMSSFLNLLNFTKKSPRSSISDSDLSILPSTQLLKNIKHNVINILSKVCDKKLFKQLKTILDQTIWQHEYTILKKRLQKYDIKNKTLANNKITKSLQDLTKVQSTDDNEMDSQEMAMFILQNYTNTQGTTYVTNLKRANTFESTGQKKFHVKGTPKAFSLREDGTRVSWTKSVPHKKIQRTGSTKSIAYSDFDEEEKLNIPNIKGSNGNDIKRKNSNNDTNISIAKSFSTGNQYIKVDNLDANISQSIELLDTPESIDDVPKLLEIKSSPIIKNHGIGLLRKRELMEKFKRSVKTAMVINAFQQIGTDFYDISHPMNRNDNNSSDKKNSNGIKKQIVPAKLAMIKRALKLVGTWEFDPFDFLLRNVKYIFIWMYIY